LVGRIFIGEGVEEVTTMTGQDFGIMHPLSLRLLFVSFLAYLTLYIKSQ
jgi:hypothetical protein